MEHLSTARFAIQKAWYWSSFGFFTFCSCRNRPLRGVGAYVVKKHAGSSKSCFPMYVVKNTAYAQIYKKGVRWIYRGGGDEHPRNACMMNDVSNWMKLTWDYTKCSDMYHSPSSYLLGALYLLLLSTPCFYILLISPETGPIMVSKCTFTIACTDFISHALN
jgi:hypothetical protein